MKLHMSLGVMEQLQFVQTLLIQISHLKLEKTYKYSIAFRLTEKGIASQESFEDIVEHIEEELSEGISEEELHIFYKVLDRINQNVKKYEVR